MDPLSAKALRKYAAEKGMEVRICCKFDKTLLTPEDTGIYFCQECRNVIEEHGFRSKSFWEILDEDDDLVLPDYSGMKCMLQDCWRDREHPEIHRAVRNLLDKMHVEYYEFPHAKENSDYCGTLHFETELYRDQVTSFDHLSHNPKELTKKMMEEKVSQLNGLKVICCCARCYKGIILGGGHPVHLMTLLMDQYRGKEMDVVNRTIEIMKKPDPRYKLMQKTLTA